MKLLKSKINFNEEIKHLINLANHDILIFSPYIKVNALDALLLDSQRSANVTIVTSWKPSDILLGVSDIEVYKYCCDHRATLLINNKIHLKAIIIDSMTSAYIGSGNITNAGLGIGKRFNYELGVINEKIAIDDKFYFDKKDLLYNTLPLTCLILVTACVMRPNLTISCFFLLLIPLFDLIKSQQFKILIIFCAAGSVIFLPLLHNYYFGGSLVLGAPFNKYDDKYSKIKYGYKISSNQNFKISYLKEEYLKYSYYPYYSLPRPHSRLRHRALLLQRHEEHFSSPFQLYPLDGHRTPRIETCLPSGCRAVRIVS